jgi:hypothetical protein
MLTNLRRFKLIFRCLLLLSAAAYLGVLGVGLQEVSSRPPVTIFPEHKANMSGDDATPKTSREATLEELSPFLPTTSERAIMLLEFAVIVMLLVATVGTWAELFVMSKRAPRIVVLLFVAFIAMVAVGGSRADRRSSGNHRESVSLVCLEGVWGLSTVGVLALTWLGHRRGYFGLANQDRTT